MLESIFQSHQEQCPVKLDECFIESKNFVEQCNSYENEYKEYAKKSKEEAMRQIQETKSMIKAISMQVDALIETFILMDSTLTKLEGCC